jgi:hypothetical protein
LAANPRDAIADQASHILSHLPNCVVALDIPCLRKKSLYLVERRNPSLRSNRKGRIRFGHDLVSRSRLDELPDS